MTYKLVMALIRARRTAGLAEKCDIFYAAGRLTDEEYLHLMQILNGTEEDE